MFKITKEFKADYKKAESIVVRFKDGKVKLELIIREKTNNKGWKVPEQRKDYKTDQGNWNNTTEAFWFESYKESSTYAALDYILKPGDELILSCYVNSNQYIKDAGLFHDELICSIFRNGKQIIRRLVLDWSCCPNNSARVIKAD